MTEQVPAAASADVDFCRAVLPKVSRTFAVSIEALPPGLREAVRTAYLLCRIVDTVEDQAGLAPADRAALYDAFDQALADAAARGEGALAAATRFERLARRHALEADGADGALCTHAAAVFGAFAALGADERAAIRPHVAGMSCGMREFSGRAGRLGRLRLRDVADLEQYCYVVAGTVGELLTALFELTVPGLPEATRAALWDRAVSFGLGLQMVNIVKDVAEDHRRGDVFLPESLAAEQGVILEELLHPEQRSAGLRVVREVSDRAVAPGARTGVRAALAGAGGAGRAPLLRGPARARARHPARGGRRGRDPPRRPHAEGFAGSGGARRRRGEPRGRGRRGARRPVRPVRQG